MSADLTEPPVPLPEVTGPLGEISQGPNALEVFLDKHQKSLLGLAALLAMGAVGWVIYSGIESSRQKSAGAALSKASDIETYQSVVTGHPNTLAGASAMVLLANSQWTGNKQDEAVATLEKFISSFPEHPAYASAKANLGSKLMAQGKGPAAAKLFDELVADPSAKYIAPLALISLGDISKTAGELDKAATAYAKVKSDFPESTFVDTATKRLATLKTKAPTEIEPPPAPVVAPAPTMPPEPGAAGLPPGVTVTPVPDSTPAPTPLPVPETPAPGPEEAPVSLPKP
jgi:predicted negative regulator of RcsB-dependent stress response